MKQSFIYILVGIALIVFPGCVTLPSPSTGLLDDQTKMFSPLVTGEKVLIVVHNGTPPRYWGEPYFSLFCMNFRSGTDEELTRLILKLNPEPGRFALIELNELDGEAPMLVFEGPSPPEINVSAQVAAIERLRYVIQIRETIETSLHVPLYVVPFGIAMCGNTSVLETVIWEVPSGDRLGSLSVTSTGEFTGLAWIFHVVFDPATQRKATVMLAEDIVSKLTGKQAKKYDVP